VVVAPAGSGKSVAIAAWVRTLAVPALWVSLDADCRDLPVFWRYVLDGIQRLPTAPIDSTLLHDVELELDQVAHAASATRLVASIVNLLDAAGPLVLVFDDLHLAASSAVNRTLELLIRHRPSHLQLVICSRRAPGFPLHRIRADGQLLEIDHADLRFTADEAAELLKMSAPQLDGADIDHLTSVTEGWAVGLTLAAQSVAKTDDRSIPVPSFGGTSTSVADYLINEVLETLSDEMRRFVLETSVIDVLDPDLCDAIRGRSDSAEMLDELLAADLFVIAVDGNQPVRRYHHLLCELLRARMLELDPARTADLHRAAAGWYEAVGNVPEAIRHCQAGGDGAGAFVLQRTHAIGYYDRGLVELTRGWVDSVPSESIASNPARQADLAIMMIAAGLNDRANTIAARAATELDGVEEFAQQRLSALLAWSYTEHMVGEPADAMRVGALAFEHAERHGLADPLLARLEAVVARSYSWCGDQHGAEACVERALRLRGSGPIVSQLAVPAARSHIALADGRLNDAEQLTRSVLVAAEHEAGNVLHPSMLDVAMVMAAVARERGDIDQAELEMSTVDEVGGNHRANSYMVRFEIERARQALGRNQLGQALETCERARRKLAGRALPRGWDLWIDRVEADVHLAAGVPAKARRLLARQPDSVDTAIAVARCMIAEGTRSNAAQRLEALAAGVVTIRQQLDWHLASAGAASSPTIQRQHLRAALDVAEPEGYVQCFVELPVALRTVIPELLGDRPSRTATEIGRRLVTIGDAVASPVVLTARELEVVGLLATVLSVDEIAERLYVSRNTVKTHMSRIYAKFKVSNRRDAVACAAAAGLIRLS